MSNLEEYVDLDQLEIWKSKLESYNNNCLKYINNFVSLSLDLQSVWNGVAASGFDENFSSQLDTARRHHDELTDVAKFLSDLAETLKNE